MKQNDKDMAVPIWSHTAPVWLLKHWVDISLLPVSCIKTDIFADECRLQCCGQFITKSKNTWAVSEADGRFEPFK